MGYLSLLLFVAILTFSIQAINLPPFPSVSSLPYQAHSFNDAAYVRQLLRRGVKYFKLDASIANKQSCEKNSNWNPSSKCYKTKLYAQEFCCIAMRGDTSGNFNFDYPFSTMDNFLDTVQQHITENGIQQILFFAINFQFGFEFGNQLAQNSIYRMAKLMEKYPKLYFGFGMDDFILQYDRVCRRYVNQAGVEREPLENLNEQSCTQKRKFISSSRFFLQSGAYDPSDPRDYFGRYRNFNVFYKAIIDYCQNGFPLWVKKHPQFPLIFWQPSDQRQIQLVIETFMSEKCRKHHGRDINGLAITSNIDPEVFQFYLKRVNQTSSSNPMIFYPNNDKIALPFARNFLSKMLANNSQFLIFGQQDSIDYQSRKGTSLEIILLTQSQTNEKVQQVRRKQLPVANGTIKIVQGNNTFIVVQKPLENNEEQRTVSMTFLNSNLQTTGNTEVDRYIDMSYLDGYYYILRQTINPTIFNVLKTNDFNKISIIASFSLQLQKAKSIESFLVGQDSQGKLKYILSGSLQGFVWVGDIRNDNVYKSSVVGFGKNSRLTMKNNGLLMIKLQNGACNSGVQINNGDVPLCDLFRFPEFKPMTSTQGTTTLIQVTLPNLIQYLQKQSNEPLTPCTEKFVHSKVFNGRNVNLVDIWSRLFFVSEYVHISEQGMLNSLFCGPSNFEKLKNNKKGLLGTIWSRGDTGDSNTSTFNVNETKQFKLIEQ